MNNFALNDFDKIFDKIYFDKIYSKNPIKYR